ncbi:MULTISPECIES: Asp-tRNA(Asn)/Glu-tRNA(Gln) amidotransferase subunit GatA [unclassified Thermosipho (in: thermotogales)]|uniref:Asp-tRNA(Asn)/Glu-tRNA(Gln) amidotransferase subunit GatA n=1 Tax=Thermosipho sp. 1244 TaxID=1755816 RepID=UPI0009864CCE|nr:MULTISPECIES: Asp-tRNA(Asn)/Glu-tRNA(Gln) amidotransferase subunit GatA [unclassified Thermosipho (in: thermotogales)]MBT1247987.1 glutamyl-tRNA amidotransferase [Thermosipho sp. 1244]OOC46585.1 glutamyl-tRNA amidotransferase [Thermosipho sp. 1223]
MDKFKKLTIKDVLKGEEDYVGESLKVIRKEDGDINAFITVVEQSSGKIPIAVKDNIVTEGIRTTCASKILEDFIPPFDATVVEKLKKNNFAIVGKTNLDEFAMGTGTEYSAFFVTKNPWDKERVAGGSSGGSAAAVASGEVVAALGSDTGGSIRQPAAFCGVIGFKPTYGLVSRYGLVAFASSLDQIGPITKTTKDAAYLMNVIYGKDERDATTVDKKIDFEVLLEKDFSKAVVAYPEEVFGEGVEEGVKKQFEEFIKFLEKKGVKVEKISFPELKYSVATYYIIAPAEVSSNLSRFDGIRFGTRVEEKGLLETYLKSRKQLGTEVIRRIMLGTFTLSAAYYDAYFEKAQKVRRLISNRLNSFLEKYDFIITPTSPITAFKIGEVRDPLVYYMMDIFTIPANLAGLPAISIPFGFSGNLPVGMQIMGKRFDDPKVLGFANFIERDVPVVFPWEAKK